jgi:hemolysin D
MNYAARVSLDRTQMQVDDKLVNLSPGMPALSRLRQARAPDHQLSDVADRQL